MHLPQSIVLTNDDGIEADGINYLAQALASHVTGTLYVVAPARCYSGCSQQVTMGAPIPSFRQNPSTLKEFRHSVT